MALTFAERLQGITAPALGMLPPSVLRLLSGEPTVIVDGQTLDPQLQLIRAIRRKQSPYSYCEPTVPEARERLRKETAMFTRTKTAVESVRDFTIPGEGGPIRVRHYAPPKSQRAGNTPPPLLVFLHGGGFVVCDLETHDEPCRMLCRHADMHVLSIDYRLAPEHPFPAGLQDTETALRWAQENAASLGADPDRIGIGGDSAGGNLATVASRLATRAGRPPAAQLLIYPATDGVTLRPSYTKFGDDYFLHLRDRDYIAGYYLGGTGVAGNDPCVSPLYAPDLNDLPPALVVTAGFDILRDEGQAYAHALRTTGTIVHTQHAASLGHAFINMTGVCSAANAATLEIARGWRTLLDKESSVWRTASTAKSS